MLTFVVVVLFGSTLYSLYKFYFYKVRDLRKDVCVSIHSYDDDHDDNRSQDDHILRTLKKKKNKNKLFILMYRLDQEPHNFFSYLLLEAKSTTIHPKEDSKISQLVLSFFLR